VTEAQKIAAKRYRSTPEYRARHAADSRAWRAANKEKIRAINKRNYEKNREEYVQYSRDYRATKPEKVLASQRNYRARHPEWGNVCWAKRRARKRAQTPITANEEFIRQFYITAARITACTGIEFHVDHVWPLSRGGEHHEDNLQVLPGGINQRKADRIPAECLI
jgi:hypothetical protein